MAEEPSPDLVWQNPAQVPAFRSAFPFLAVSWQMPIVQSAITYLISFQSPGAPAGLGTSTGRSMEMSAFVGETATPILQGAFSAFCAYSKI